MKARQVLEKVSVSADDLGGEGAGMVVVQVGYSVPQRTCGSGPDAGVAAMAAHYAAVPASTRALSFEWRGRERVNTASSSEAATW